MRKAAMNFVTLVFVLVVSGNHGALAFLSSTGRPATAQTPQICRDRMPFLRATDGSGDSETTDMMKESKPMTTSPPSPSTSTTPEEDKPFIEGLQERLQQSLRIVQESRAEGASFTQLLANVLAGDYDQQAIGAQIDEQIQQSPCVMFTWERSPSCVKAVKAFETMGILDQITVVRLDDPWDEGSPIRAEIGKRVGRSSVPMIFINGKYVGGFDGGISDQAPGIQTMAFQGTLRPLLKGAGIKLP